MPTAVEMKWLGNTTAFSVKNAYGLVTALHDAKIPRSSVSAVTINWGDRPSGVTDGWDAMSAMDQQRMGSRSAPAGLNSFHSDQLTGILVALKPFMDTNGGISVSGLTVTPKEAAYFSHLAGVPVSFSSSPVKDDWPGIGGTFQDDWQA